VPKFNIWYLKKGKWGERNVKLAVWCDIGLVGILWDLAVLRVHEINFIVR
jgi:hypothetical protein